MTCVCCSIFIIPKETCFVFSCILLQINRTYWIILQFASNMLNPNTNALDSIFRGTKHPEAAQVDIIFIEFSELFSFLPNILNILINHITYIFIYILRTQLVRLYRYNFFCLPSSHMMSFVNYSLH